MYNPADGAGTAAYPIRVLRGIMSEIREDNSVSRVATYFVFAFLLAAIIETVVATIFR
jgi:hypothetical protein